MLRISILIAALVFVETTSIGVSSAQAVVCSYDLCVSNCNRAGYKRCLRGCDRRIARRLSSGLCPWHGAGDLSLKGT
jgi:hypothetical protein